MSFPFGTQIDQLLMYRPGFSIKKKQNGFNGIVGITTL